MIASGSGKTLKTIIVLVPASDPYALPNGSVCDIVGIDDPSSFTINAEDGTVSSPISADLSSPETFLLNVDINNPDRPKVTCVSGTINILVYQ